MNREVARRLMKERGLEMRMIGEDAVFSARPSRWRRLWRLVTRMLKRFS